MYHKRHIKGKYYLHEHPLTATSWHLPSMRTIVDHHCNHVAVADQCAYGLTTKDPVHGVLPAKKPTRFATNSPAIAAALSKRCECQEKPGVPKHGLLIAGRAAAAAIYTDDLCGAMCVGLKKQLSMDGDNHVATRSMDRSQLKSFIGQLGIGERKLRRDHWTDIFHEQDGHPATRTGSDEKADGVQHLKDQLSTIYKTAQGELGWDDPNNCPLDIELIRGAREVEIAYFRKQGVYTKVPRSEALRRKAKIIQLRWVDTNKGDSECPNVRARLVGK